MGLPRICNDPEHTRAAESGDNSSSCMWVARVCSSELWIVSGGRLSDIVAGLDFEVVANNSVSQKICRTRVKEFPHVPLSVPVRQRRDN